MGEEIVGSQAELREAPTAVQERLRDEIGAAGNGADNPVRGLRQHHIIYGSYAETPHYLEKKLAEYTEDMRKAVLEGDVDAYIKISRLQGVEPTPNDIYDFRQRGGLPLLQVEHMSQLSGGIDIPPSSRLGQRIAQNDKDAQKILDGDLGALRRAAFQIGIPASQLPGLLRQRAALNARNGKSKAGGSSSDGTSTDGTSQGAGDPAEAKGPRNTWSPPERSEQTNEPSTPESGTEQGGGDSDAPPSKDDPDPGNTDDQGGGDADVPPDNVDPGPKKKGGGSSSGSDGDKGGGGSKDPYPVPVPERTPPLVSSHDDDDDDDGNAYCDGEEIHPPLIYGGGYARPPRSGPDKDPPNPEWGGGLDDRGVIVDDRGGVYDPAEDAEALPDLRYEGGYGSPPKTGPDRDPANPKWGGEDGGLGGIDPNGPGGGTGPISSGGGSSAFRRAGGFVLRTAVTVGITIAAVKLGGVMADRGQEPESPAVSESGPRGSTGTAPVIEKTGSSGPIVEGAGAPKAPEPAAGSKPSGRMSDGAETSSGTSDSRARAPAQRVPDASPTRLEEGSSPTEDEQGPTDLERAPNPQPEKEGDPDTGFEPGLED